MVFKHLFHDLDAYMERDPAASSRFVVAISYPGFHSVLWYRLSHWLWSQRLVVLARFVGNIGRFLTGVDIHPGAEIGSRLVIDHAIGVVIGETAEIEDNVTLYHNVTLGGIAPAVESEAQKNVKRHPTLLEGSIIGSGAQVLGPITVGRNARVGANAVVVKDVPENCTVAGIPAQPVATSACSPDTFSAYGTPTDDFPDPDEKAMGAMLNEISALRLRVQELERELEERIQVRASSAAEAAADPDKPTSSA
ncbi:MAG: serine O-acetyltransferase [Alphaproteobacteria bacterium]|nr:serine O-acetyltransferase [Alphaproteobacteria bacterium]